MFENILGNPKVAALPIAICLNKQDLKDTIFIDEELILQKFPVNSANNYKIFLTSSKNPLDILIEPFNWIQTQKSKPITIEPLT